MKNNSTTCLWIFLFTIFTISCNSAEDFSPTVDRTVEKEKIKLTIENSICWAMTKDTTALYSSFIQDSTLFIFHPDSVSTLQGFSKIREAAENVWLDDRFKATACNIRDLRIELDQDCNVAWFAAYLDDISEWDGRAIGWYNTRWTGVLEKKGGKWLIMQMHFSFPSDR